MFTLSSWCLQHIQRQRRLHFQFKIYIPQSNVFRATVFQLYQTEFAHISKIKWGCFVCCFPASSTIMLVSAMFKHRHCAVVQYWGLSTSFCGFNYSPSTCVWKLLAPLKAHNSRCKTCISVCTVFVHLENWGVREYTKSRKVRRSASHTRRDSVRWEWFKPLLLKEKLKASNMWSEVHPEHHCGLTHRLWAAPVVKDAARSSPSSEVSCANSLEALRMWR